MQKAMVIGIAGGTGSGKSTITRRLVQRFGNDVCVLSYDNYYKAQHEVPFEERVKVNYDHPDAFDTERFLKDLRALKAGRPLSARSTTTRFTTGWNRQKPCVPPRLWWWRES